MEVHDSAERANSLRRVALREALSVFAAVSVATWLLSRLETVPFVRDHLHLLVGALFLVTAMRCAERLPGGLPRYGMSLGGLFDDAATEAPPLSAGGAIVELAVALWHAVPALLQETLIALLVCAVVFPPFALGFYYWNAPTHAFEWLPQRDLASYVLTQILVVGLPEEALFRGYLQGRLADAWPKRARVLGVSLPLSAWLLQAVLFALLHFVVDLQPARLAVFFPALLFGWLAAWRGGIGAAVLVHASCNVLSDLLVRGFL